jgi:hypothetical protein
MVLEFSQPLSLVKDVLEADLISIVASLVCVHRSAAIVREPRRTRSTSSTTATAAPHRPTLLWGRAGGMDGASSILLFLPFFVFIFSNATTNYLSSVLTRGDFICLLFEAIKNRIMLLHARGHVHLRRGPSRCRGCRGFDLNLVGACVCQWMIGALSVQL